MTNHSSPPPYVPEPIRRLPEIAANLRWSWCPSARALFRRIDPALWARVQYNPLAMLQEVDPARLAAAARDPDLQALYERALAQHDAMGSSEGTWFAQTYPGVDGPFAYFCAEFGIHSSLPIYSGGLGILAGDHCKAASDLGIPLVGVGLAYHKGYFDQKLSDEGWQEDADEVFDPSIMPLRRLLAEDGSRSLTVLPTAGGDVHVGAWAVQAGRTRLILLDTDIDGNAEADRELTHKLYGGGEELRLKQEWILGVGGVRVLRGLGVSPAAWHANEGHAAFMFFERLRERLASGEDLSAAIERVRRHSVFTTHTPVAAGHDHFSSELIERALGSCWDEFGLDRGTFMDLGGHPDMPEDDSFHMTAAALRLSERTNGVSRRHGAVTRSVWRSMWPGRQASEVPIGHVTNGVHRPTWVSRPLRELLTHVLEGSDPNDPDAWDRVLNADDHKIWETHVWLKNRLFDFIRQQARVRWRDHWTQAGHLAGAGPLLDPTALTLGFARRFATYKRADLLLRNEGRLLRLLTNPDRPVQIIFAGKAHPADDEGKRILQRIYNFARDPRAEGRIAFLEDYEKRLAHRLVEGVDVWVNLPRVPLEACGTSGMKAAFNGVPQLGTLDGWWAEGYTGMNGWVIPPADEGASTEDVDTWDWDHLFNLLEDEVVPLYWERDADGVPVGWVQRMKHAIREAGRHFTAAGMLRRYTNEYYVPALRGEAVEPSESTSAST